MLHLSFKVITYNSLVTGWQEFVFTVHRKNALRVTFTFPLYLYACVNSHMHTTHSDSFGICFPYMDLFCRPTYQALTLFKIRVIIHNTTNWHFSGCISFGKHQLNLTLADNYFPARPRYILTINQSKQKKTMDLLNKLLNGSMLDWLYTKKWHINSQFLRRLDG